jgi:hypothetical protein
MQNGFAMQKIKNAQVHTVSLNIWHRMHNEQMIRAPLAAFKMSIYQKHYVRESSYPTITKLYKFKQKKSKIGDL